MLHTHAHTHVRTYTHTRKLPVGRESVNRRAWGIRLSGIKKTVFTDSPGGTPTALLHMQRTHVGSQWTRRYQRVGMVPVFFTTSPRHLAWGLAPGRDNAGKQTNERDEFSGDLCSETWHRVKLETKFLRSGVNRAISNCFQEPLCSKVETLRAPWPGTSQQSLDGSPPSLGRS